MSGLSATHVKNTLWNLAGLGLPLVLGLAAVPVIVAHWGPARFGVLGLIWAGVGYAGQLDFGLGRAMTKFVAAALGRGDAAQAGRISTLIVALQCGFGILASAVIFLTVPLVGPLLVPGPSALRQEAIKAFRLAAALVPLVLVGNALRGVLEGGGRFDVANRIRIPMASLGFVLPAAVVVLGGSLSAVVATLIVLRVATVAVTAGAVPGAVPQFRWGAHLRRVEAAEVLRYSGWVGAANVLSPLLFHWDRLLLGALMGPAAVGFYTAPFEVLTRSRLVPGALATALFPAFAARPSGSEARSLMARATGTLVAVLAPPTVLVVLFAEPLLAVWLGTEFAAAGHSAARLLAVGVMVNGLAHVPFSYLQGVGRADLPTKFLLWELLLHVPLTWLLIERFGITGAAGAWTLRALVDAGLVVAAAVRVSRGHE